MRSRRGEVPFVAVRVGRSNDPREVLGLARELRVSRAEALGFVVLWEEMILELGDAMNGRLPKGYTAAHIAAKLGWEKSPRVIVEALKRAGLLSTQRTVFLHPYWSVSVTGAYARDRAELREHWRQQKADQRAADVREMSGGHGADVHTLSDQTADIKKETVTGAAPPPAPPRAGGSSGASRWRWLLEHHRRPTNPDGCIRYLGALTGEEWELVQWLTGLPPGGGPYKLSRKKRVLELDTYSLLSKQHFLQLRPEWVAKLRQDKAPPRPTPVIVAKAAEIAAEESARHQAAGAAFLLEQLADPSLSEKDKAAARARWTKAHPEGPAPWEAASEPLQNAEPRN